MKRRADGTIDHAARLPWSHPGMHTRFTTPPPASGRCCWCARTQGKPVPHHTMGAVAPPGSRKSARLGYLKLVGQGSRRFQGVAGAPRWEVADRALYPHPGQRHVRYELPHGRSVLADPPSSHLARHMATGAPVDAALPLRPARVARRVELGFLVLSSLGQVVSLHGAVSLRRRLARGPGPTTVGWASSPAAPPAHESRQAAACQTCHKSHCRLHDTQVPPAPTGLHLKPKGLPSGPDDASQPRAHLGVAFMLGIKFAPVINAGQLQRAGGRGVWR